MSLLIFAEAGPRLARNDVRAAERTLGINLPDSFVEHYLRANGGVPSKSCFCPDAIEIAVAQFLPLRHPRSDGRTVESIQRHLVDRGILDPAFVPFAVDWGSNYVCLAADGRIYFVTTDTWHDDLTAEQNRAQSTKRIADSFAAFLTMLESELE